MGLQQTVSAAPFGDEWKRVTLFIDPPDPTTQLMPFIQIASINDEAEPTVVYIDRLEVFVLDGTGLWDDAFLGAGGTGP